jgi:RHS repeat-associated protein
VNTTTDYYLTDALGSVRQLTDAQGEITLANAYEPYGTLAQSAGSAQTSYGYTGEYTDPSGMVYLRARFYMPNDGRFLTRDTWMGDTNRPLSLNRWMYGYGNPVKYTDPSGHFPTLETYAYSGLPTTLTSLNAHHYNNYRYNLQGCNTYAVSEPPCYEWKWIEKEYEVYNFPFGFTRERIIVPQLVPCGSIQSPPIPLFQKEIDDKDENREICIQLRQLFDDLIDEQAHSIRVLRNEYEKMREAYSDANYHVHLALYLAELLRLSNLESLAAQVKARAIKNECDVADWENPRANLIPPAPPPPPSDREPGDPWDYRIE